MRELGGVVVPEGLDELLRGPLRRRMRGDVYVQDPPRSVMQDDQHEQVLPREELDEGYELPANARPANLARLRLAPPGVSSSLAVPPDHDLGLDDVQGSVPRVEQPHHPDPEDPVLALELRALHAAPQNGDLLAEGDVLQHESLSIGKQYAQHGAEDAEGVHGGRVAG
jgi:hypothetical protein